MPSQLTMISLLSVAVLLTRPLGGSGFTLRSYPQLPRSSCTARASLPYATTVEAIGADGLGAALPPPDDLADEVMLRIVLQQTTDEETNALVWKYLGYRYDEASGAWNNSAVFPNWRKKYPDPPDLIGVTRTYSREVDEPVLRAVQSLQRSVPTEHKDNLRTCLKPLGWKGFKMEGLTPNMTRRAQVAQWLIYYRKALHGVSVEELRRRKEARAAAEEAARTASKHVPPTGTTKQSVI